MAVWNAVKPTNPDIGRAQDPANPDFFITWKAGAHSGWRVGVPSSTMRKSHPSGALADYHHSGYFVSQREKCPCGLPFVMGERDDVSRYCCKLCVATVGAMHDETCSAHFQ